MTVLQEVYASAPYDKVLIETLQIDHAAIDSLYYAKAYDDVTADTESETGVVFVASGIKMQLPENGVRGREDFIFQVDNVTGAAIDAIETVLEAGGVATVTYRAYVSTDLTAPAYTLALDIVGAKSDAQTVVISATFRDFINKKWPRLKYTTDIVPGLKYNNA